MGKHWKNCYFLANLVEAEWKKNNDLLKSSSWKKRGGRRRTSWGKNISRPPCFSVNQGAFLLLAGFWHGQTKRSQRWLIEDKISIHTLNDPLQSLLFLITFLLTIILTERQVRCSWNEKCIDELILKLHWALIDLKSKSLRSIFVFA